MTSFGSAQGKALVRRVLSEKRAIVLPLAIAFVANVLVYAIVVYPLARESNGSAERAAAAAAARQAAARDDAAARALVTGKAKADEELAAFFDKVVPADLTAARRTMFAPISALADKAHVQVQQIHAAADEKPRDLRESDPAAGDRPTDLGKLSERVVLAGDYRNVRNFIYELETAPDFVIIDSITLVEGQGNEPQRVTVELSTYYKLRANGH